jgi:hypothetical protein
LRWRGVCGVGAGAVVEHPWILCSPSSAVTAEAAPAKPHQRCFLTCAANITPCDQVGCDTVGCGAGGTTAVVGSMYWQSSQGVGLRGFVALSKNLRQYDRAHQFCKCWAGAGMIRVSKWRPFAPRAAAQLLRRNWDGGSVGTAWCTVDARASSSPHANAHMLFTQANVHHNRHCTLLTGRLRHIHASLPHARAAAQTTATCTPGKGQGAQSGRHHGTNSARQQPFKSRSTTDEAIPDQFAGCTISGVRYTRPHQIPNCLQIQLNNRVQRNKINKRGTCKRCCNSGGRVPRTTVTTWVWVWGLGACSSS